MVKSNFRQLQIWVLWASSSKKCDHSCYLYMWDTQMEVLDFIFSFFWCQIWDAKSTSKNIQKNRIYSQLYKANYNPESFMHSGFYMIPLYFVLFGRASILGVFRAFRAGSGSRTDTGAVEECVSAGGSRLAIVFLPRAMRWDGSIRG